MSRIFSSWWLFQFFLVYNCSLFHFWLLVATLFRSRFYSFPFKFRLKQSIESGFWISNLFVSPFIMCLIWIYLAFLAFSEDSSSIVVKLLLRNLGCMDIFAYSVCWIAQREGGGGVPIECLGALLLLDGWSLEEKRVLVAIKLYESFLSIMDSYLGCWFYG